MRYFWNSFTCASLSIVSENSPMPVFVPYITSLLASFSSSMARQILMRSRASGANSTVSLCLAIATIFSIVREEPSRVMGIDTPWVVLRLFYPNAKLLSSDKRQEHRQQIFRHLYTMKSRLFLSILLTLLLISVVAVWFFFRSHIKSPAHVFPATVDRDCAPWDGSAFTVSIPLPDGSTISISIYWSPDIKLPSRYSFPDETM